MTKTRHLVFAVLTVLLAVSASAQQAPPPPGTPPDGEKPPGRLRVWVFPGKQTSGNVAVSTTSADGVSVSLATAAAQVVAPSYRDLPAGIYSFDLKEGEKVLGQRKAKIDSKCFYTLVVWLKDGQWSLELYADSSPPGNPGQRALRILNFAAGATTTVSVGRAQKIKAEPDSIQEAKLSPKITPLEVSAQPPGTAAPARTLTEVDLVACPAVYVLVSPDYRGRLRPQIIQSGEPPAPAE